MQELGTVIVYTERDFAGYIKLELPVFHIGYMKATLGILQCICKTCSHVLLDVSERRKYLK